MWHGRVEIKFTHFSKILVLTDEDGAVIYAAQIADGKTSSVYRAWSSDPDG
jgi:hypothetical protein